MKRAVYCAAVLLFVAGCGGGGGGGGSALPVPTSTPVGQPTGSPGGMGAAEVHLVIPSVGVTESKRRPTSKGRRLMYVSAGTQAVAVQVNNAFLNPDQISVKALNDGSWSIEFPAPAGTDAITIYLGDANGNLLSAGTVHASIQPNATTILHLVFDGVPSYVTLTLDSPNPLVGQQSAVHLSAIAYDASFNQIIGDPYLQPIQVTDTDTTGKISLDKSDITSPTDAITITYSGRLVPPITFSAVSPSNGSNVPVTLIPNPYTTVTTSGLPLSVAADKAGNVWFTECTRGGACRIGEILTSGQLLESGSVQGAFDITAGPDGNMWFTEGNLPFVGRVTPAMQVTEYRIRYVGQNQSVYEGPIVSAPDGNLWFIDGQDVAAISTMGTIVKEVPLPSWYWSESLVVGSDGALWCDGSGVITRVTTGGSVKSYVIDRGIYGALSSNIVLGSDGDLYFLYIQNLYKMDSHGNVSQLPYPGNFSQWYTLGPDANLWGFDMSSPQPGITYDGTAVLNPVTNAITLYPLGPSSTRGAAWSGNMLWSAVSQQNSLLRFNYNP